MSLGEPLIPPCCIMWSTRPCTTLSIACNDAAIDVILWLISSRDLAVDSGGWVGAPKVSSLLWMLLSDSMMRNWVSPTVWATWDYVVKIKRRIRYCSLVLRCKTEASYQTLTSPLTADSGVAPSVHSLIFCSWDSTIFWTSSKASLSFSSTVASSPFLNISASWGRSGFYEKEASWR